MAAPVAPCPVRRVVRGLPKLPTLHTVSSRTLSAGGAGVPTLAGVGETSGVVHGRSRGKRVDRFFRDIHGIESPGSNALVLGRVRRQAAGDHDVSWRYWTVVCADRRSARPR